MKLWVIMGNDFPNGVCDSKHAAETAIKSLKERNRVSIRQQYGEAAGEYHPGIHYRSYEFTLNEVKI